MFKSETVTNCATKSLCSDRVIVLSLIVRMEQFICAPRFRLDGSLMKPPSAGIMKRMKQRVEMFNRTPKPDHEAVSILPEPPEADYSDELTEIHIEALRSVWTQDESAMGSVVHEFQW